MTWDYLDGERFVVLMLTLGVIVAFAWKYAWGFRRMSLSQRVYVGSTLCFMITTAWDTGVLIGDDVPFSWRLVPLIGALLLAFVYLTEPRKITARRLGLDIYSPISEARMTVEEEQALLLENQELRDRLYEVINRENKQSLRIIELEMQIDNTRKVGLDDPDAHGA